MSTLLAGLFGAIWGVITLCFHWPFWTVIVGAVAIGLATQFVWERAHKV